MQHVFSASLRDRCLPNSALTGLYFFVTVNNRDREHRVTIIVIFNFRVLKT